MGHIAFSDEPLLTRYSQFPRAFAATVSNAERSDPERSSVVVVSIATLAKH